MPYLSAFAVVIHYEEALYQVYAPLPLRPPGFCCGWPDGLELSPRDLRDPDVHNFKRLLINVFVLSVPVQLAH